MPRRFFKADALLAQASESAQSEEFGPEGWNEGFKLLLGCLDEELELSRFGRTAFRTLIVGALTARLRIVKWAQEHPELVAQPVERPLVVVGMARAGTTLLSCLLDQDDRLRSLLNWEVTDPVPPPLPEELRSGPRVEAAAQLEAVVNELNGGMRAIHYEGAAGPTEALGLLAQHFVSITWLFGSAPTYSRWLIESDHLSAYRYQRLALQVLQAHTTRRWSLKAIQHVIALDALTATYPDARLVIMHRDPIAMITSACSLFTRALRVFTEVDCRAAVASSYLDFMEVAVARSAAFIDEHPTWPIVEIRYHDFISDPIAAVKRIYESCDEPCLPAVEQRMRQWLVDHPQGEFGRHSYSPSDLGLDRAEIEDRFAAYRERYDLPRESVPA